MDESEREERDFARAWLSILAEGDIDKIATMITELADRSRSLDSEALSKLERSATVYAHALTRAAFKQVLQWRKNSGCSCGCNGCEEGERIRP